MVDDYSNRNPELGRLYPGHIEALRTRHDRALESSGAASLVVFSGSPKFAFLDDFQYPFKPNPHFLSWVPLQQLPHSYLVYTPGEQPIVVYCIPHDYWHPVPDRPDGYWTAHFDIRIVNDVAEAGAHLPADRDKCILIGEVDDPEHAFGIERISPSTAINILHYARGSKTAYEIACMRLASQRGAKGHIAAEAAFFGGCPEFDIHRAYCKAVSLGDNELPYGNIVALNEHGAILHYTELDRDPPPVFHSFLIDAGAQVHGYASDITRTYSHADQRFAELIELVNTAQLDIVGKVRAGVDYVELHIEAHRLLGQVLVDAGLARGAPDTLLELGVTVGDRIAIHSQNRPEWLFADIGAQGDLSPHRLGLVIGYVIGQEQRDARCAVPAARDGADIVDQQMQAARQCQRDADHQRGHQGAERVSAEASQRSQRHLGVSRKPDRRVDGASKAGAVAST